MSSGAAFICWYTVITDIEERLGIMAANKIVKVCGVPYHRIIQIQSGKTEPYWSEALKLLDAHHDVCQDIHDMNTICKAPSGA